MWSRKTLEHHVVLLTVHCACWMRGSPFCWISTLQSDVWPFLGLSQQRGVFSGSVCFGYCRFFFLLFFHKLHSAVPGQLMLGPVRLAQQVIFCTASLKSHVLASLLFGCTITEPFNDERILCNCAVSEHESLSGWVGYLYTWKRKCTYWNMPCHR